MVFMLERWAAFKMSRRNEIFLLAIQVQNLFGCILHACKSANCRLLYSQRTVYGATFLTYAVAIVIGFFLRVELQCC